MAATTEEINEYLYAVTTEFVSYGYKLAKVQKLGKQDIECYKFKFRLLNHFIRVITDYFDSDDYENVNFFTTSEIEDVMRHINNITGSNYWLDL